LRIGEEGEIKSGFRVVTGRIGAEDLQSKEEGKIEKDQTKECSGIRARFYRNS